MIRPLPSQDATDVLSAGKLQEVSELFKLFSDVTRLQILRLLSEHNELHVQGLCKHLGQSQPAVSHHLAMLRLAEVISVRRSGKFNFYFIASDNVRGRMNKFLDTLFDTTEFKLTPNSLSQERKSRIMPVAATSGACQANYSSCSP